MFSQRLKELRVQKGMTQADLAAFLGVDRTTIGKYETTSTTPDFDTLVKIAKYFDVSADYLVGMSDLPRLRFIESAQERYGNQGKQEAEALLDEMMALFAGGRLPEEDKDEFFRTITQIYFDTKEAQRKENAQKKTDVSVGD